MNAALERSVSSASHGTVYFLSVASCGHAFHCLSVNYQLSTWALFEHKTRPSHAHVYLEEKQMHRKNNWCQEFCWCRSNGSVISLGQGKGFQPSRRGLRGCHSRFQTPLVRARAHCIARYRCPLTTLPRQLVFPRTLSRYRRVPLGKPHGKMTARYNGSGAWPNQQRLTVSSESRLLTYMVLNLARDN